MSDKLKEALATFAVLLLLGGAFAVASQTDALKRPSCKEHIIYCGDTKLVKHQYWNEEERMFRYPEIQDCPICNPDDQKISGFSK